MMYKLILPIVVTLFSVVYLVYNARGYVHNSLDLIIPLSKNSEDLLIGVNQDLSHPRVQVIDIFIDQLAADTWNYLSSEWATENNLPWSWRSEYLSGGDFANPAEIGLYALAWVAAYDFQRPWSPSWEQAEEQVTAILDQLRAWQTGSQSYQPHGPNAFQNSLFYQWYWISFNPPYVGPGAVDKIVPSIDNAWLAASLIVIREYAFFHHHMEIANKADAILADMEFTMWYDRNTHLFYWGDTDNPQGGHIADYYSNENRIINFIARAMGQLSKDEFHMSLNALKGPSGSYDGIDVEAMAWDGSYFTYTTPALFIRELDTTYGLETIVPASQAQISYAEHQGYDGWGLSDCFSIEDGEYIQQGAPPAAMPGSPESIPGLVSPHASALALITPFSPQAVTNLVALAASVECAYHPGYGFRDSVMVFPVSADYGKCSYRFSALAQLWIFLAIANYQNNFIWDYFYRDVGVIATHREMFGDYEIYLPLVIRPIPMLTVADFDTCNSINNLGGEMGVAFNPPDRLIETYIQEEGRGCIVQLSYQVVNWSSYWLKLQGIDLSSFDRLIFDIRSAQPGLPEEIKIELKRAGGSEVSKIYLSGLTGEWQTVHLNLTDFGPADYASPFSSWSDIDELVFTFEANFSGSHGVIYLDNIFFW
jgi:hypothetical protein